MKLQLLSETNDPAPFIADDAWCAQEKLNGVRLCLVKRGSEVTGYNRRGTERPIPATTLAVALLSGRDWTIDGELVGDTFTAFDVLECNELNMREFPMALRFGGLGAVSPFAIARLAYDSESKARLLDAIKAEGGEGVVFKHNATPYLDGRDPNAVKFRFWQSESFIVADRNTGKGSIGLTRNGRDCGRVCFPMAGVWPKVGDVVEVRFTARGATGKCINPVLIGVRDDVDAREIA